jgi:hypothetical protein
MDILLAAVSVLSLVLAFFLWYRTRSDGSMILEEFEDGRKVFSLELEVSPEELSERKRVIFKVKKLPV